MPNCNEEGRCASDRRGPGATASDEPRRNPRSLRFCLTPLTDRNRLLAQLDPRVCRSRRSGTSQELFHVWINRYHIYDAALPFGGYKQSGWGREMGHDVLELYP